MYRYSLSAGLTLVALLWCLPGLHAQIRSSFVGAQDSRVRYMEPTASAARSCRSLLAETDFDVAIVDAQVVASSERAPEHCRVFVVIRPEIRVWINLPTRWNQRLYAIGEGGYAGHSNVTWLWAPWQDRGLQQHFVTVFNDSGHDERILPGTRFALNSLEREIDFGFRAMHLATRYAKTLAETYYGKPVRHSYYDGCSTGGRQGMVAARRFPDDYDGILAGAPAFDMVGLMVRLRQTVGALDQLQITPPLLQVLGEAIYERCDLLDGLADRVLDDPRSCDFAPERDLPICDEKQSASCFSRQQVEALKLLYGPVFVGGEAIQPGLPLGAEISDPRTGQSGWVPRLMNFDADGGRLMPLMEQRITDWLPTMAFEVDRPDMTWREFNLERDLPNMARSRMIHDATDPDLSPLADAEGKMIVYHGWSDTGPSPMATAEYIDRVYATMGEAARDHVRLFMVPGMFHCAGGTNVDHFDGMTALIEWVESGNAPDQIEFSRLEDNGVSRVRPVCAWPAQLRYDGQGPSDEAGSFACE